MPRSLQVAPEYIDRVKKALLRNGFARQEDLAEALEISRDTVSRFLNGKPVGYPNFTDICERLKLDWEEIADLGTSQDAPSADRVESLPKRLAGFAGLSDLGRTPPVTRLQPSPNREYQGIRLKQILFKRLLDLDFEAQREQVRAAMRSRAIGAFLVHGQPGYGQQALSKRLFQLLEGEPKRIHFDMGSQARGKRSRNMWNHLTKQLEISANTQPEKIADFICQWRQTKDVLLTVYGVDCMLPGLLSELIEQFWQLIVDRAERNQYAAKTPKRLLLFLVDYEGNCHSNIPIVQDQNHPHYPRVPLLLERACTFPQAVLDRWIKKAIEDFVLREGLTAQMVLDASDGGIPEDVYEAICKHCGISWEGDLAQWSI